MAEDDAEGAAPDDAESGDPGAVKQGTGNRLVLAKHGEYLAWSNSDTPYFWILGHFPGPTMS